MTHTILAPGWFNQSLDWRLHACTPQANRATNVKHMHARRQANRATSVKHMHARRQANRATSVKQGKVTIGWLYGKAVSSSQ